MSDRTEKDRSHSKRPSFPYKSILPEGPASTTDIEELKRWRDRFPKDIEFGHVLSPFFYNILNIKYTIFLDAFDDNLSIIANANDLRRLKRALEGAGACLECSTAVQKQDAALAATYALDVGMIFVQLDLEPFLQQAMKFTNNPKAAKGPEARARKTVSAGITILEALWVQGVRGKEDLLRELVIKWHEQDRGTKPQLQARAVEARVAEHRDDFVQWIREKEAETRQRLTVDPKKQVRYT